jgi:CRP-like cAMP-binding protein
MTMQGGAATDDWARHPFIARIGRYIDLSPADLESLRYLVESDATIKKRRDLVIDGYEYRKLCFVEDGFAARYKLLRNGKRQIVDVVLPGDVIGLPSSFFERAAYSVIALSDMKLQVCLLDDYVRLCYQQPKFGLILSWLAMQEIAVYAEHTISTGRRTPVERLAHFLLEMHARLTMVGRTAGSSFHLPFSQEVIGDALGLSIPHLNRTLAQLRKEGLITVNGHLIGLADLDAIQRLGHYQAITLSRIPVPDKAVPS